MNLCAVYISAGLGCVLIFIAFRCLPEHIYPRWILYLGRISYGLYVYHVLVLMVIGHFMPHITNDRWMRAIIIDAVGLCVTIAVASCSYHFFELRFLRLKARFTFISSNSPSRPVPRGLSQTYRILKVFGAAGADVIPSMPFASRSSM
jgi:peptidoglycan/LPS O-acetylase OafA/YrhL